MSLFNLGDWFSGGGQTQAEADANFAAQKVKLNQQIGDRQIQDYYDGIDPATDATLNRDQAAVIGNLDSTTAAAAAGFKEGLGDGLGNVKAAVTGWGPFKLVPVWVWLVALVALFLWAGGGLWLKGILKKRA